MTTDNDAKPVVVGVDGSDAALNAAMWAIDEAIGRGVPLRLVHVVNAPHPPREGGARMSSEIEYGETVLRAASAAIAGTGEPVKVETDILWGPPIAALIDESQTGALVCVGTVGIGMFERAAIGSTAADLAQRAHCPVAVIRPRAGAHGAQTSWVAVGVEGRQANDTTMRMALVEARLRRAPVLAVDVQRKMFDATTLDEAERRVRRWRRRNPDVRFDTFTGRGDLAEFLADNRDDLIRQYPKPPSAGGNDRTGCPLAIVGDVDAAQLASMVGPHDRALRRHAQCSVVVAR
jgi:nucleotide-binding universal stress UspA family protein